MSDPSPTPGPTVADVVEVMTAARLVPTRTLLRLAELALEVRDPTNSAPLTELLDLIDEVADA